MSVEKCRITCRAWCGHTNRAPRDETGENTKGNARGPNNRIKRASSDLGIEAFRNAESRLFKVVTRNFYNAHVALVTAQISRMNAGAISVFK